MTILICIAACSPYVLGVWAYALVEHRRAVRGWYRHWSQAGYSLAELASLNHMTERKLRRWVG